jgi:hypothetical protein
MGWACGWSAGLNDGHRHGILKRSRPARRGGGGQEEAKGSNTERECLVPLSPSLQVAGGHRWHAMAHMQADGTHSAIFWTQREKKPEPGLIIGWELSQPPVFPRRQLGVVGAVSLANGPGPVERDREGGAMGGILRDHPLGATPVKDSVWGPWPSGEQTGSSPIDQTPQPLPSTVVPINISSMPAVRLIARASN